MIDKKGGFLDEQRSKVKTRNHFISIISALEKTEEYTKSEALRDKILSGKSGWSMED